MTETEEFNSEQAKQFELFDNENIEFMFEGEAFEAWLYHAESKRGDKRSRRSIATIIEKAKRGFVVMGGYLSLNNLRTYKGNMIDGDYKPNSINSALLALNTYSKFLAEKYNNPYIAKLRTKTVKVQPKQFIDNVISRADYDFMVAEARKKTKTPNLFLSIRIMGTTGVRVSELLQVKVEHIKCGYVDVIGKGAKQRRIYFPKNARDDLLDYLSELDGGDSGYVIRRWCKTDKKTFLSNTRDNGDIHEQVVFIRGLQTLLAHFGESIGVDKEVCHPHGFRHFFAKEFLKNRLDIALLADLLGHSSLDITRIYLKMTSKEQAQTVDDIVTW